MVRAKPPLPAHKGLFGKPTVVNNVLSLATVPFILAEGAQAYRRLRHGPLARHHADPARRQRQARRPVRDAPSASRWASWSTTSAAARRAAARCARCRSAARSAPISRRALFDTPFDYEAFAAADGLIGHGGIVVFDDTRRHGAAGALRHGVLRHRELRQVHALPHRLDPRRRGHRPDHRAARSAPTNLALLEDLCETMKFGSLCALGGLTPYPVMSALEHFPEDFGRRRRRRPRSEETRR